MYLYYILIVYNKHYNFWDIINALVIHMWTAINEIEISFSSLKILWNLPDYNYSITKPELHYNKSVV